MRGRWSDPLHVVSWVAGVGMIMFLVTYMYLAHTPLNNWIIYYSVEPLKENFKVNERLKFLSHSDLKKHVGITFNDILFCKDVRTGRWERYNSQNTTRVHADVQDDRYTIWPFSPGVAYPTECYLESNIEVHLPMNINRTFVYNGLDHGQTFNIVEE